MKESRYELRSRPSAGAGRASSLAERDPFRYGHRWVEGPDGYQMVPLTYADLLDPQEDDFVTDDNLNRKLAGLFQHFLETRFEDEEDVAVWSDFKLRFGEAGKGPGPDVCVVRGVRDRERRRGSFWIGHEPGDLTLVIEIVSRHTKSKDYRDTKAICERRKVPEMILIELQGEYLSGPYKLSGYRLGPSNKYRPIALDEKGGLVSEQTDIRIRPDSRGWGLEVVDLRTGERLSRPEDESRRAQQESEKRRAAEKRAQQEAERAQQAELQVESAARTVAETLLSILENRGIEVDEASYRRILECRDLEELRQWTGRAFAVATIAELFDQR